jgi:hypothetical protein
MTFHPSVLLLEFNELSPSLMDGWIEDGRLPNFQRLRDESEVYITDAEEQPPYLVPWIQWITVHSGLSYAEHKIFHLGDGPNLHTPCIWDILSNAGYRVWVCGSMNVRYEVPLNGALLPDPWTKDIAPYPETLLPYFRFVRQHVTEYTRDRVRLPLTDYLQFISFVTRHGLSSKTLRSIAAQILSEMRGERRWKRAVILDKLQFDLFSWYWHSIRPHFATFFLNSTAHFQHAYWRNMTPQLFEKQPSTEEQAEYQNAILFGYQEMDKLIGRFLDLVGPHTTVLLCTALSQQPCLLYEEQGGKVFYKVREYQAFLEFCAIHPQSISPVMSESFHLTFEGEDEARDTANRLTGLRVGGRQAMNAQVNGSSVFTGCQIYERLSADALLVTENADRARPFFDLFYQVDTVKSGMHHPDGMLWIRAPQCGRRVHTDKVSLLSIAPTILSMFSLPRPSYMRGESLVGEELASSGSFLQNNRDGRTTA